MFYGRRLFDRYGAVRSLPSMLGYFAIGATIACGGPNATLPPIKTSALPVLVAIPCAPPTQIGGGTWSGCVQEAEVALAIDRKGFFEIKAALAVSDRGRVTSVAISGDASGRNRSCIEKKSLQMVFEFPVACSAGVVVNQSYSVVADSVLILAGDPGAVK